MATILDVTADALADGFDDDERYAKAEEDAEAVLRRLQEAGAAFDDVDVIRCALFNAGNAAALYGARRGLTLPSLLTTPV